tara:strand:+ start:571 stop:741 length:171 start_codon:yes stop_codon:yes gene_type:complete
VGAFSSLESTYMLIDLLSTAYRIRLLGVRLYDWPLILAFRAKNGIDLSPVAIQQVF